MVFSKIDVDGDGKLTKVEILAFLINLLGPYVLIIGGILSPITENLKTMIVGAGLGGVGVTRHSDCVKTKEKYISQSADYMSYENSLKNAINYETNDVNDVDEFNGFY